jgi:phosphoadenosine phosphosulfate reductase
MKPELQKKVDFGIKLIQAGAAKAAEAGQPIEIAYSGGKDSDCILELARMAGVKYRAIYKNTTIDPPGTIKHAKENGVEIMPPKMKFFELVQKRNMPTRRVRHCCEVLKEYKVSDYVVIGVRREESTKRKLRYTEPEVCRVYSKKEKVRQYLPLLNWTSQDVEEFIKERGIKCHPLYYDEQGQFHVERRLGCVGCPLAYKKHRIEEFKQYPGMAKLYVKAAQKFLDNHPDSETLKHLKDGAEWFTFSLYCDSYQEWDETFGPTLFDNGIDCKKFLEEQFGIVL